MALKLSCLTAEYYDNIETLKQAFGLQRSTGYQRNNNKKTSTRISLVISLAQLSKTNLVISDELINKEFMCMECEDYWKYAYVGIKLLFAILFCGGLIFSGILD